MTFTFPATWQASKFDEWAFFRQHFLKLRDHLQAVDILVLSPDQIAFMVEVKDYRHPEAGKPSALAETIVNKVLCTLAALLPAKLHADTPIDEKIMSRAVLRCERLQVIVHIEQPASHQPRVDLADLKQKLKSKLRAIDAHPKIVSMAKPLAMAWHVS
ncbi:MULTISPECIES: hypothetical protein [unclassified Pseudomonas]|uniref:hypothetical protein n=1 Tax=unclassified Pseudomonas TaxID=196821 RepID=UPI00076CF377|nr:MULTISPECIES: hypothetical protein [unclassified Pseudomonas]KVV07605.1 cysteinyl-tRNA synthetase [Pseudomonas sp. TAD18]KVV08628.1 cysteinyl-tRNA synthetase [Pseudomonas sp. TAA207]